MIPGQLDLLELLEPKRTVRPYSPWERVARQDDGSCAGCGTPLGEDWAYWASVNHPINYVDTAATGHTVCGSMSLRRNHVLSAVRTLARHGTGDPYPCCHDSGSLHGKRVRNPTRAQLLDHARDDWARAAESWALHPGSLAGIVREVCLELGVDPAEVMHP